MVGIATLTMKASTPNMNCAATTIASTHQRRELSTGVLTIWCMTGPSDFLNPESQAFVIRAITSQVRNGEAGITSSWCRDDREFASPRYSEFRAAACRALLARHPCTAGGFARLP